MLQRARTAILHQPRQLQVGADVGTQIALQEPERGDRGSNSQSSGGPCCGASCRGCNRVAKAADVLPTTRFQQWVLLGAARLRHHLA